MNRTEILKRDSTRPTLAVFAIQAATEDGEPLSSAQIDAARATAASVLERVGCDVSAVAWSIIDHAETVETVDGEEVDDRPADVVTITVKSEPTEWAS